MSQLATKKCHPCKGGIPPLDTDEVMNLLDYLRGWAYLQTPQIAKIAKKFTFPDFVGGLAFVNAVARIAEAEGHHPDLHLSWGQVRVEIWTHKISGLTENDFILAAKIDELGL